MYSFVTKKNVILIVKYKVWKCNNVHVMLPRESSK